MLVTYTVFSLFPPKVVLMARKLYLKTNKKEEARSRSARRLIHKQVLQNLVKQEIKS
jgi:hypothetical protein